MERRNGHRAPETPSARRSRRIVIVAALVALLAVAFGGGYLLARGGGETDASPAASPSAPPSGSIEPSTSEGPSSSETPSSTPAPVLEDGLHFVYRSAVAAPRSLRVDVAEFLTGDEAQEAAEDRGDEVTNDYYIVNDERRLRSVPVSDDVIVLYVPRGAPGPDPVDGTWDAFVEAVNDDGESDIDGDAPWWITIEAGEIVQIVQQYLP